MSFFSYDMLKNLKPGEFAVYNFIISHMEKIPSMNIRELAEITGVSTTTVLRFCEKAGCEGYTEFKYRIKCRMSEPEGRNNYDSAPALQFIKNAERDELFQDKLGEVAELIAQSGQVIFSGDGEGRSLAQYGIYLFNSVGKAAFRCEKENGTVCPEKEIKSMLFILSVSGEDEEMVFLLNQYKESGAFVISITNTEQCLIAKMSDINFSCYMPETYGKNTGSVRSSQLPVIYILESLSAIISFRE